MDHKFEITNRIKFFLDENNWEYTFDDKKEILQLVFNIAGKVRSIKLIMDLSYDDSFIVMCTFPMNADKQSITPILRLINLINYNVKYGNFELDENDGEIRYRMTVDCEGITPSDEMIEKSIVLPAAMIRDYGEYLIEIIMGYKTFEEIRDVIDTETN